MGPIHYNHIYMRVGAMAVTAAAAAAASAVEYKAISRLLS